MFLTPAQFGLVNDNCSVHNLRPYRSLRLIIYNALGIVREAPALIAVLNHFISLGGNTVEFCLNCFPNKLDLMNKCSEKCLDRGLL